MTSKSPTTIKRPARRSIRPKVKGNGQADFGPVHPGEVLLEEFLGPLGLTQYQLAKALNVPQIRISQIVKKRRAISPDTALRLARYFGTTAEFWLRLQSLFDLETVRDQNGGRIEDEVIPRAA